MPSKPLLTWMGYLSSKGVTLGVAEGQYNRITT